MASITVLGNLIVHMKYVGKEDRTEFTNWSLPEYDRNVELANILLSTLQTRGAKSLTNGLVVPSGKPK
jgi:hypothetical protein